MKCIIIRLFLYICIALIPVSCGTRKVQTSVLKNAEIISIKEESKTSVTKSSEVKETTKDESKSENIDENKEVIVNELYNDQGVIKSRVITINTNKKSNNITSNKEALKTAKNELDSAGKKSDVVETKKETKVKEKTTTRKNDGWYYAVGIISVVGLLFWLKHWK